MYLLQLGGWSTSCLHSDRYGSASGLKSRRFSYRKFGQFRESVMTLSEWSPIHSLLVCCYSGFGRRDSVGALRVSDGN